MSISVLYFVVCFHFASTLWIVFFFISIITLLFVLLWFPRLPGSPHIRNGFVADSSSQRYSVIHMVYVDFRNVFISLKWNQVNRRPPNLHAICLNDIVCFWFNPCGGIFHCGSSAGGVAFAFVFFLLLTLGVKMNCLRIKIIFFRHWSCAGAQRGAKYPYNFHDQNSKE